MNEDQPNDAYVTAFKEFYSEYYDERISVLPEDYDEGDTPSLTVDYRKIQTFDPDLAADITEGPDVAFKSARVALHEYAEDHDNLEEDALKDADLRVAYHDTDKDNVVDIRNIRSKHVDRMVTIEGIVKTTSKVLPRVTTARFVCQYCDTWHTVEQPASPSTLKYPPFCQNEECGKSSKKGFEMNPRRSTQVDFQKVTLEEPPEELRGGQNPQSVDTYIQGDITGEVTPGDRVAVTGVLRATHDDDNPVFSTFLEANYIHKEEKEFEEIEITGEEKERIQELAEDDNLYDRIRNSVAPSIWGYEDIKMAVAMQLFSGVPKEGNDTRIRGDIHTLIVGDPGTGKSEIIESAKKVAPRGVYTVGKGSSAAGLTASAVRDSDMSGDQKWSLEAGALVLADKGIACVDEIDKMRDEDRSALHEALEQQTVSVNKAGINATLKSRCSLLAAANPVHGRFDGHVPLGEQIDLEPALISRFDLIFTVADDPDEEDDTKLANHIINTNIDALELDPDGEEDADNVFEDSIDPDLLRKYIAYARQHCDPKISDEAHESIRNYYVELRDTGSEEGPIAVTAREVQSCVRLAESAARMRLADEVTKADATRALQIKQKTLEDVGIDPVTGELDADAIETGTTKSQRDRIKSFAGLVAELTEEYDEEHDEEGVPEDEIYEQAREELDLSDRKIEKEMNRLQRQGDMMEPTTNHYRYID